MHESIKRNGTRRPAIFLAASFSTLFWLASQVLAQKEQGKDNPMLVPNREQADALFLKAKEDFVKKDFDRAAAGFRACLEIRPGHADALFFLAQVEYLEQDFAQALTDIKKAEAAHAAKFGGGGPINAQERKALLEERAEKEREVAFIEDTLTASPCKSDVQLESLPKAIENLRREISSINAKLSEQGQPEPAPLPADYSYINGNILFKMNKFPEAEGEYLKAIQTDPRHLAAHNNLINLCYMTRDFEKALKFVEQAEANGVEINPKLKEAVTQIAKKDN